MYWELAWPKPLVTIAWVQVEKLQINHSNIVQVSRDALRHKVEILMVGGLIYIFRRFQINLVE